MITAKMFPIQSFSKNIFFGETKTVTVHASGFLGGGGKWSMREPDCGYDVSRNDIAGAAPGRWANSRIFNFEF